MAHTGAALVNAADVRPAGSYSGQRWIPDNFRLRGQLFHLRLQDVRTTLGDPGAVVQFTTAAPGAANFAALPSNFGAGRDQWTEDDLARIHVTGSDTNETAAVVMVIGMSGDGINVDMSFAGSDPMIAVEVNIVFLHSIQL